MKTEREKLLERIEKYHNPPILDEPSQSNEQPMDLEAIKTEFFKNFGKDSFRGYPLEQCHSIFEWFKPHLTYQEDSGWIDVSIEPEFGEEYNVIWDLQDGDDEPVVTTMVYDKREKVWRDQMGANTIQTNILKYKPLPSLPKELQKSK